MEAWQDGFKCVDLCTMNDCMCIVSGTNHAVDLDKIGWVWPKLVNNNMVRPHPRYRQNAKQLRINRTREEEEASEEEGKFVFHSGLHSS